MLDEEINAVALHSPFPAWENTKIQKNMFCHWDSMIPDAFFLDLTRKNVDAFRVEEIIAASMSAPNLV